MTPEELSEIMRIRCGPDGNRWFPPRGHPEARLMIISSHPNFDDVKVEKLISGDSGNEVSEALRLAGIPESCCWMTSVVKYGLGSKTKPTAAQIESCSAQLKAEIAHVKPALIMTLGGEAFKPIMEKSITQGDYVGEIIDSPSGKLMANHSPVLVYAIDPTLRPDFRANFVHARKFLQDQLSFTPYEYRIVTTPEENEAILNAYMSKGMWSIGYDAEWCGKKYTEDEVMYTFQYSCEPHKAIILNISLDGKTENKKLLHSMQSFLANPKAERMGWNIRSDDKRLKFRGLDIPDHNLAFDGMKAVAYFDSRWNKGLETGIKRFTNYRHYYVDLSVALKEHKLDKSEMSKLKFLNHEVFYDYCAGDAVSHRTACLGMRAQMLATMPREVVKYYFQTYLPLSHYILDMETTGLTVDQEIMEDITHKYSTRYVQLKDSLNTKLAAVGVMEFNPNASKDKISLLYTTLELTPQYYTKAGKAPKPIAWYKDQKAGTKRLYRPSANGKAVASLRWLLEAAVKDNPDDTELRQKYDIVKNILQLGRVGVFSNKFLSKKGTDFVDDVSTEDEPYEEEDPLKASYWNAIHSDGKIHADFYECLDPFRSSSRVNVQNCAAKVLSHIPECFEGSDMKTPANIRQIFWAGDKDWRWVECDVQGADVQIAAYLSKDQQFINDLLNGGFHMKKMREYFRDDKLSKEDVAKYVSAKAITFRIFYTAELKFAAIPIQAEIFAESGVFIPIDEIIYALETWNRYTDYMKYRDNCKAQVKNDLCIRNARGFKLNFERSENFNVLAGWYNESLAFPIASELALFMWDVSVSMKHELQKQKLWMRWVKPVNTVHDANYWIVHKDLMKDGFFPEFTKEYFTNKVRLVTGDPMGLEMTVSDRWKGKDISFAKETKWDFQNKCWVWK